MEREDLFIIDNNDAAWKVQKYLPEWCELLNGKWQNLEKIRILMGDEVSKRTYQGFEAGLGYITNKLDESIEREKEENDFLDGVPVIAESIRKEAVYTKALELNSENGK